jgi:uncharacterized protein (TIGR03382 family)
MKRVFFALLLAGCLGAHDERTAREAEAIIHGTNSDASQDAVVLVMRYDNGKLATEAACSGTLLTPKLVLTARHCVATTDEASACKADGTPISGGGIGANFPASAMFVFPGSTRPDLLNGDVSRAARGAEILDDGGTTLCNHDIALVVLDRPIPGAKIAPVRLDGPTAKGELVTSVGWGYTETEAQPDARQQRTGIAVTDVGPSAQSGLASRELMTGEGICQGDSGGPLLAASGAVIALASRGGNGTVAGPPAGCLGAENIFTMTSGFKDFLVGAYAHVGQDPWPEGGPNPLLAKLGAACSADGDCQSSMCDTGLCTSDCTQAACPGEFTCSDKKRCVAAGALKAGGCNASGGAPGAIGLLIFGLVVSVRRRRNVEVEPCDT